MMRIAQNKKSAVDSNGLCVGEISGAQGAFEAKEATARYREIRHS